MPRLEILAVDCPVLFIGGLVEGIFPRAAVRDIFFNDTVREQLGLIASEELLEQDRFLFYQLTQSPTRALYLSHPRYSGESALVPSNFIDELAACRTLTPIAYTADPITESAPAQLMTASLQSTRWGEDFETARRAIMHSGLPAENLSELLRRVRITAIRHSKTRPYGEYEGMLIGDKRLTFPQKESWNITALEQYAACPMQYWLEHIIGLEEWPEFTEGIDALEKGTAIHEIMQRFYEAKTELPESDEELEKNIILLKSIARRVFERLPVSGFIWQLEQERYLGTKNLQPRLPGLLELFYRKDAEWMGKHSVRPHFLEWSFGMPLRSGSDRRSITDPLILSHREQQVKLRGKIDRMDMHKTGGMVFYDYKTGHVPPRSGQLLDMYEGYSFQLSVYWQAIRQLLPKHPPLLAVISQIRDTAKIGHVPIMGDAETRSKLNINTRYLLPDKALVDKEGIPLTLEQLLERNLHKLFTRLDNYRAGVFRHSARPDQNPCKSFCAFRRMCQKHPEKQKSEMMESDPE